MSETPIQLHVFGVARQRAESPLTDAERERAAQLDALPEFAAQERYRQALELELQRASAKLLEFAGKGAPSLQIPQRAAEQYAAGYAAGTYVAAVEAAKLIGAAVAAAQRAVTVTE